MRDKRLDNRATAPHELLLIRAGHHLWAWWKASRRQDAALYAALETVWKAKEELRVELRVEYLNSREKQIKRLHAHRWGKV